MNELNPPKGHSGSSCGPPAWRDKRRAGPSDLAYLLRPLEALLRRIKKSPGSPAPADLPGLRHDHPAAPSANLTQRLLASGSTSLPAFDARATEFLGS